MKEYKTMIVVKTMNKEFSKEKNKKSTGKEFV